MLKSSITEASLRGLSSAELLKSLRYLAQQTLMQFQAVQLSISYQCLNRHRSRPE